MKPSQLLHRFQRQAYRVDAPPLIGGDVIALALEHMPQVRATVGASRLGAHHSEGSVLDQIDRVVLGGFVERRPSAMTLELGVGSEKLLTTRTAVVDADGLGVGVF